MTDSQLITRRRQELESLVSQLKSDLADAQQELGDLDTAERVLARLSGAERPSSGEEDEQQPQGALGKKPKGLPTMPKMIEAVLSDALVDGKRGLTPREARSLIAERFWPDVKTENVNAIMWRMEQRGQLEKGEDAEYRLPDMKSASGGRVPQDTPEADIFSNQSRGREAGPGGGT